MSENGMDIPGEEEDDDISPDLLRGLLKKTKKFEEGEVASLLGYNLNHEHTAKHVRALLGALKDNGYFLYKRFKEAPGKDVTALADLDTIGFGHKQDIRTLHRVLNKKLPPMLPVARRTGGAGTQSIDPVLRAMAASQQVSADAAKNRQAKEAFYASVMDVETVVEDAYILNAFLIAKGLQNYITDEADKSLMVKEIAPYLAKKVGGVHHLSIRNEAGAMERTKKVARMDETLCNIGGALLEDARSGNFCSAWNHNVMLSKYNVQARPQFPTHKAGNSVKKADVVLDCGGAADANGVRDSLDFVSVMEWKNNYVEGADREGIVHSLLIQEGIYRKRFLVFSVAPELVQVFGVYWKEGDAKARRVKLAEYRTADTFFAAWLPAMLYFARESPSDVHTPATPAFNVTATGGIGFTRNVFKVEFEGSGSKSYIYKVYDYENRQDIPEGERRWLNWDLVRDYYPDSELVVDLPALKIFRYPFLDSGEDNALLQHVPPSIESFKKIGVQLKSLHDKGWVWGDVRLANMLFIGEDAQLLDLDFAREESDSSKYPPGYSTDRLPRHPSARAGAPMKKHHDVYSFWRCFQILVGTGMECPGATMDAILPHINIKKERYARPDPLKIAELHVET